MNADNRNLVIWLSCVCVVIYLMIVVGGVTRLTQSGLSMVDWKPIMGVIHPGQHGSTFGGNPVAAEVGIAALQVVVEEQLAQNARTLGKRFRSAMSDLADESSLIVNVRGKGLLNAVIINDTPDSSTAWDLCVALKNNGLLAKPTHGNIIRFAPPLVITEQELDDCIAIIRSTVLNFKK